MNKKDYINFANKAANIQIGELKKIKKVFNNSFVQAIELILSCKGKVIFSGVGKNSFICKKAAATFSSVGISSFFVDPTGVSHGDAAHIHSDSDLLHYVQQKAAERCNLALSNVQNSWSNSNNAYNLDLYNSTIGGSKIYCLDAVTVAAKNSGIHSATSQLRRW